MRDWGVRDTPHAFKENKPFVVLLLAEANTQCEGVLKSFWPGAVSKEPGLTAVPSRNKQSWFSKVTLCSIRMGL